MWATAAVAARRGREAARPPPRRVQAYDFYMDSKLEQQIAFIVELDKLKTVLRQTLLTDSSRRENTAEHSWHLGVMAMVMADRAVGAVDIGRAVKMALAHDIIEIEAGDTFAYDVVGYQDKEEREKKAADHLFGMLPSEIGAEMRALWDEFEEDETPTAQYVNALDRLQPLLNNWKTEGGTWRIHKVKSAQIYQRMAPVKRSLPDAWPQVESIVREALESGWISD